MSPSLPTLKIAIAQTLVQGGPRHVAVPANGQAPIDAFEPITNNLRKVQDALRRLQGSGATIAVFPEYFLQGIMDKREYMALPAPQMIECLQELARLSGISIIGSVVELRNPAPCQWDAPKVSPFHHLTQSLEDDVRSEARKEWLSYLEHRFPQAFSSSNGASSHADRKDSCDPRSKHADDRDLPKGESSDYDQLINVAYCFEGGSGKTIGRYVKKNLWIAERTYLSPGEPEQDVFEIQGVKAGMQICWDLAHMEGTRHLAQNDVDIIFAPTYWTATDSEPDILPYDPHRDYEVDLLRSLAYVRAFESETALVLCNAGGTREDGFAGGSGIWMPYKGELKGVDVQVDDGAIAWGSGEHIKVYDVPLDLLKKSRRTYQIRADWRQQSL